MADVEVATVLPRELRLGVPATMPQARSYLFKQRSTRDYYNPGETIQINIPRLQRSYLTKESYLTFRMSGMYNADLTATATGYSTLVPDLMLDDCGAYGFFEKIEVFDYLGSTVLESISGIPQVMSLLFDLGMTFQNDHTLSNASMGLGRDRVSTVGPSFDGTTAYSFSTGETQNAWQFGGLRLVSGGVGTAPTNNYQMFYQFAIPLPSFLGFLTSKNVPLHNGFTIVLTVANLNKPCQMSPYNVPIVQFNKTDTSSNTLTVGTIKIANQTNSAAVASTLKQPKVFWWQLSEVNMECQVLELGPVAESMLLSSTQGQPLIVHTKAMRHYVGNTKAGQAEFFLNLNLNVASLTNILWFMRQPDSDDNIYLLSSGNRTRNCLQRWHFQYGSTVLPQTNGIEAMSTTIPTAKSGYTWVTDGTTIEPYNKVRYALVESFKELYKARPFNPDTSRIDLNRYFQDRQYSTTLDTTYPSAHNFTLDGSPNRTCGKFACGLNLELAPNKNGDLISGLNTNGMNTQIVGKFHPSFLNHTTDGIHQQDTVVDAYAEYDAFINISPGVATTVSF
jgi:hypothetical protein